MDQKNSNQILIDRFNRISRKLRISVTDRCNMKCIYCMPNGNVKWFNNTNILNFQEIIRLASIFTRLGITKIRITGGEPLLRHSLYELVQDLNKIKRIQEISMTTNGLLLEENADQLKASGLDSVNISLDTFKEERLKSLNGITGLNKIFKGIEKAIEVGLKIKINTVLVRNRNDDELVDFVNFSRKTGLTVRFIEFMPLDGSGIWNPDLVVGKKELIEKINSNFPNILLNYDNTSSKNNPETLYSFDDKIGKIGFISSVTDPFCSNCDRIRLTSDGRFLTCLFEKKGHDLKKMIRNGKKDKEIIEYIKHCHKNKPEGIIELIRINGLKPTLNLMHTIGG
ncbi:MAG: GTP 3',8-cyclase MoaA [Nitrososphaeraceae archaeon]